TEVAFASRHPHLSVVQFVKDQCRAVSFDSSAAEKRDYEAPPNFSQAFLAKFLASPDSPASPKTLVAAGEVRII
ncbi:MAG TPA: hypothetical protein VK165_07805, partial [Azonexus sp.]|nr:hypothetical protein [Azonexus sp.]